MKKKLKLVFFGLLALVFAYYSYTKYQNAHSLKGVVHQDAVSVVKVGIHEIKETLVLDAISSPRFYYKNVASSSKSKTKEEEKEPMDKGVELMPHNLMVFTLPNYGNTFFTVFKITDNDAFKKYLKKEFGKKIQLQEALTENTYQTAKSNDDRICLGWNDKKLVVATALNIDAVKMGQVFEELLLEDKFIYDLGHPLLKALRKTEGHMVYANDSGTTSIQFEDGIGIVHGQHSTQRPFAGEVKAPRYKAPSFSLHYDDNFEKDPRRRVRLAGQLKSTSFFTNNNLNEDTVLNALDGSLSMDIVGRTTQTDTVITYGYDDNFEKIAQKTTQEKEIPEIHIDFGTSSGGLLEYLDEAGTLSPQSVFEPFPLYQFSVTENAGRVHLGTNPDGPDLKEKTSSYFFQLQVDFERLQQDLNIIGTKPLFSVLNHLNVHAWQADQDNIVLEGELRGKKEDINILTQVFLGLKQGEAPKATDQGL